MAALGVGATGQSESSVTFNYICKDYPKCDLDPTPSGKYFDFVIHHN